MHRKGCEESFNYSFKGWKHVVSLFYTRLRLQVVRIKRIRGIFGLINQTQLWKFNVTHFFHQTTHNFSAKVHIFPINYLALLTITLHVNLSLARKTSSSIRAARREMCLLCHTIMCKTAVLCIHEEVTYLYAERPAVPFMSLYFMKIALKHHFWQNPYSLQYQIYIFYEWMEQLIN
jgi:hypothetical protein